MLAKIIVGFSNLALCVSTFFLLYGVFHKSPVVSIVICFIEMIVLGTLTYISRLVRLIFSILAGIFAGGSVAAGLSVLIVTVWDCKIWMLNLSEWLCILLAIACSIGLSIFFYNEVDLEYNIN